MSVELAQAAQRLADTIRHGNHSPADRAALFDALEAMVDELIESLPPSPPPRALVEFFPRPRHAPKGNGNR